MDIWTGLTHTEDSTFLFQIWASLEEKFNYNNTYLQE